MKAAETPPPPQSCHTNLSFALHASIYFWMPKVLEKHVFLSGPHEVLAKHVHTIMDSYCKQLTRSESALVLKSKTNTQQSLEVSDSPEQGIIMPYLQANLKSGVFGTFHDAMGRVGLHMHFVRPSLDSVQNFNPHIAGIALCYTKHFRAKVVRAIRVKVA